MISYLKGNLLEAPTQALVNAVNTVGVMGKDIALQCKEAFPNNYKAYVAACKKGECTIGKLWVHSSWSDEDNTFISEVPELPGCMADGESYAEALQNAQVVIDEWIETAKDLGRKIPSPKGRLVYA